MNNDTAGVLEESAAELVLRYLKHRWGPALPQLLPPGSPADAMRLDDLDLDTDAVELERAVGLPAVERVATALLALEAPPAEGSRVLKALAPEVTGPAAHGLLGLIGLNLAFRLRTDGLLQALVTAAGRRTGPRPAPALVGKLLGRARSGRAARALAEQVLGSDALGDGAQGVKDALLAAIAPPPPPPRGARLHVDAPQEAVERALVRALEPRKVVRFSGAGPDARRYLVLRRRGAWTTVLAEGDDVAPEVGQVVARQGGVRRVAWARFDQELDLRVWEGPRLAFDKAKLGAAPEADDVAGHLRALGVLDLDPDHPRGETHLLFVEHLGGGPPLGHERKLRQAGARPVAVE
jgi:hypothetical protein